MYRNITLICLLTVWLSACGGEGAADPSPEELARLQTMPAFTVDDNYEVFINTLVDQSKFIASTELAREGQVLPFALAHKTRPAPQNIPLCCLVLAVFLS